MSSRSGSQQIKLALIVILLFACVMVSRLLWASAGQPTSPANPSTFGIEVAQAAQSDDEDLFDCDSFDQQADAQAQLLEGDPYGLDDDGDGIACNERDVELAAQRTEQGEEQISEGEEADGSSSQLSSEQYQYGGNSNYQYGDDESSGSRTESGQYESSQYDARLLEAGGPSAGPVPELPGGGCPPEFPVEDHQGGCIPPI